MFWGSNMHKRNGLTALRIKRARKPGRHADGGGLYLAVSESGAKSWVFLWKRSGKRRAIGLGSADTLSLADARSEAANARKVLLDGRDPRAVRNARKAGTLTFGEAADRLIESVEAGWRNAKHRYQWRHTLMIYAAPLRATPVTEITTDQVLRVLKPLWLTKSETATRLRSRIERVLDWAKAHGHRNGENPAAWKGNLKDLLPALPPKRKRIKHYPAMPHAEVPTFTARLRAMAGLGARALELTILTAARTGETLGAQWSEIDFEEKVWVVPAHRMKADVEHVVPLSDRAVRILKDLSKLRTSEFIFPGIKHGQRLSGAVMKRVLERAGITADKASVHGFRSSFRDWAGDCTTFPREVAEAALAHMVGDDVERAYRRGDALEKRRKLMVAWANYCEPKAANVIAIRSRAN